MVSVINTVNLFPSELTLASGINPACSDTNRKSGHHTSCIPYPLKSYIATLRETGTKWKHGSKSYAMKADSNDLLTKQTDEPKLCLEKQKTHKILHFASK